MTARSYLFFIPLFFCSLFFSCAEDDPDEIYNIIGNRYYYIAYDEQENLEYYQVFYFTNKTNVIFEEITKDLSFKEKPIYLKYIREENTIYIKGEKEIRIVVQSENRIRETLLGSTITYNILTDQTAIDALNELNRK